VLNDDTIPWVNNPEAVFDDLPDIRVIGDDLEILEDIPDSARGTSEGAGVGTGESAGEGNEEGETDIELPNLESNLELPDRKAFPIELINSLVQKSILC
jgi:hypothetical protein